MFHNNCSTLPEDEMVSSVQEVVSSEEQHINTSNLDLVGDLTEVTGSVQPQQPGEKRFENAQKYSYHDIFLG